MSTSTLLKHSCIFLFLSTAVYLISCNSKVIIHGSTAKAKLPVLYIAKSSFHNWHLQHNTKIMFRFTYFDNKISLTGWAPIPNDSSDIYDSVNLLPLNVSPDKQVKFSDNRIYLGNLRLTQQEVVSLDNQLTSDNTSNDLVFIPMLDATYPQQVSYKIYLSSSTHIKDTLYTVDPKADPSPPATRK